MKDNRNQDDIGENELLVVSFGTGFSDSRRRDIGGIERAMEDNFPGYSVRRAFASQIIIDRVKKRDGVKIDHVTEALDRAMVNGVKSLVVQPTYLLDSQEYRDLLEELEAYAPSFSEIAIGKPLLSSEEDYRKVVAAITDATTKYDDGETAVCFMGHGTLTGSNDVYQTIQDKLAEAGCGNYFVGTMKTKPSVKDVLKKLQKTKCKRVLLYPLMIVAGAHANKEMAGHQEGSWKNIFEENGYEVECVKEGIGRIGAIQDVFVEHAREAVERQKGK